jgi:prepilin-type N-terminal cleavage/methylation domain-containing protein
MTHTRRRKGISLIELLVVVAIFAVLAGLTAAATHRARSASVRAACADRLRQVGLALHNYESARYSLPPGVSIQAGKDPFPYMGWQTRILPFVEQDQLWRAAAQAYQKDKWPFNNPPHIGLSSVVPLYTCPADGRTSQAQPGIPRRVHRLPRLRGHRLRRQRRGAVRRLPDLPGGHPGRYESDDPGRRAAAERRPVLRLVVRRHGPGLHRFL